MKNNKKILKKCICKHKVALFTLKSCHWPVMWHAPNFSDKKFSVERTQDIEIIKKLFITFREATLGLIWEPGVSTEEDAFNKADEVHLLKLMSTACYFA